MQLQCEFCHSILRQCTVSHLVHPHVLADPCRQSKGWTLEEVPQKFPARMKSKPVAAGGASQWESLSSLDADERIVSPLVEGKAAPKGVVAVPAASGRERRSKARIPDTFNLEAKFK